MISKEDLGKERKQVLKDIRKYIDFLNEGKISPVNFFIEDSYLDTKGERRPCYQLTKEGCEMVANKMTGKKGVLFTATYVKAFNDMQDQLKSGQATIEGLSPQLQALINLELNQKKLEEKIEIVREENRNEIQAIRDVVAINITNWRADCKNLIVKIAHELGGNGYIRDVNNEVYSLMRTRLNCRLDVKRTNMRRRMADEGVCKSKRDKVTYLDVIETDNRLKEGYIAIVKELAIKYGVTC